MNRIMITKKGDDDEKRWSAILIFTMLGGQIFIGALQANEVAEKAAITASGAWLSLVDRGDYAESWNQATGLALKIPNIQGYA
jgi:hypothetical protein